MRGKEFVFFRKAVFNPKVDNRILAMHHFWNRNGIVPWAELREKKLLGELAKYSNDSLAHRLHKLKKDGKQWMG